MRRMLATIALAVLLGFVAYRATLLTMSSEQASSPSPFAGCSNAAPPHFDPWTGVPKPWSCPETGASLLYAAPALYEHFQGSVWVGLAIVPIAFMALRWWRGRPGSGPQRGAQAIRSLWIVLLLGASVVWSASVIRLDGAPLLTGVDSCWAGGETGMSGRLLVDRDHGTSFNGRPVMWPTGFTAARRFGEVEVRNAGGTVVAMTGRDYFISHGRVADPEALELMERLNAFPAAANCGYAWDFVDCTADPADTYCRKD
jgi:hypothetical protein